MIIISKHASHKINGLEISQDILFISKNLHVKPKHDKYKTELKLMLFKVTISKTSASTHACSTTHVSYLRVGILLVE